MSTVATVVWTIVGIAVIVAVYQILRTAMEAESFLRGLRQNLIPILENHRETSGHLREIAEKTRETADLVQRGVMRPVLWAAGAWATIRKAADRLRRKDGDHHGGT